MYVQATVSCECGCISRFDIQSGEKNYVCPKCKKEMDKTSYQKLLQIMGEFADWNTDILKFANGLNEPNMRAVTLSISDLEE